MDVLGRWIKKFGRPVSWYSDRHGIFRAEESVAGYDEKQSVATQFSRALEELGIQLILANSPQAKGRVERLWNTAQDRLVKELRLAKAATLDQANAVLEETFSRWFNRRCTNKPLSPNDAHRPIGKLDLDAILSIQHQRVVMKDYTIRFENRVYQLLPPALPGQRDGKVIIQKRADGSMKIQFKGRYLAWEPVALERVPRALVNAGKEADGIGALPPIPRSLAHELIPVAEAVAKETKENDPAAKRTGSLTVHQSDGRSGRTPALPCPPAGGSCGSSKRSWRPASNHPWRQSATA